ncbi:MAG: hypothetical protein Q9181_003860 [Wetmoreana brouardii]
MNGTYAFDSMLLDLEEPVIPQETVEGAPSESLTTMEEHIDHPVVGLIGGTMTNEKEVDRVIVILHLGIHTHRGQPDHLSLVVGTFLDWAHDKAGQELRPSPSTMSPKVTDSATQFHAKQQEDAAQPAQSPPHLFSSSIDQREATLSPPAPPIHPASEASQLISALDVESLQGDPQRHLHDQSPIRHSISAEADVLSETSSMNLRDSYDRGDGHQGCNTKKDTTCRDLKAAWSLPSTDPINIFPTTRKPRATVVTSTQLNRPSGFREEAKIAPACRADDSPNETREMWNDEDNNPYGSFDRRGSTSPDPRLPNPRQSGFERPMTPTSETSSPTHEPPEFVSRPRDLSDDDEDNYTQQRSGHVPRKKGGYDSRIEQILYEHPDLQIVITDAGKSHESGGSYIVYTIRTGDLEVRRRYSEFHSLRSTLVNLHPTLIIPPIPEKHSMADYAAKPTKAKEDVAIIDLRKRMLTMFLNRCRKMKEVREDGVWWRFLDPNASWNEILHSHPVASIPKNIMKAPPLDPSNPTPAHQWLPVPSTSAKLRSVSRTSSTGTPTSPPHQSIMPSAAAHTIPGPQLFGRFPPSSQHLSEPELDPYFNTFESNTRELELLLQGSIEKVNRRTLTHLSALSTDMAELGARYNGFALSEQSATVAAAIERIGQAVDSSYIATEELSSSLGANFAEPMRESAQFAGVVRSVLRYRIMKRIQQEMTKDELYAKKNLLESLERSEMEAKRIEQYLSGSASPSSPPKRSTSSASARSSRSETTPSSRKEGSNEDAESVDSDFPPGHANGPGSRPSSSQGPSEEVGSPTGNHKKSPSGGFVANKIFGRISHAIHGVVDVDPERTRRDTIGKTKESLVQLEQALEVSEKDVKDASAGVLKDLKRFQLEKEDDLKRYMIAYARCHINWAKRNVETWREAKDEVNKIDVR